ncbi:DUF368 domain-containing protein [Peloplasma aerotolerans]|uniref:DUF368 domain-containing protein n=1 Tax=Peloplasma aerotolerans TaxID=3044389 RepID=A0AAW6U5M0_9MOLU|nr:DUF368 domain-containing protein [Mariniplasma sp. M4Ah]MDI6452215.1 DUF368 domain-containing protein [Mariniplasma sp. M4Ah]
MNHLIKIIKGIFVGIGSILPGISGSMIAAILKIYQDLIQALNKFTKQPLKAISDVWQYIVGVIVGLMMGFLFISTVLELFPIPLTLLFIGFILGAVPGIINEFKTDHYRWHHFLVMFIAMASMIGFLFVKEQTADVNSWYYYFVIFMIGVITAASLITPGLSAATMLMALGYFRTLIELGDGFIQAFLSFNFSEIGPQLPMLGLLIIGVVVGLLIIGKIMYQLLIRYKAHFYFAVLGIVIITPFNILFTLQGNTSENVFQVQWYIWGVGLILFILGLFITYKISDIGQKEEDFE